jgi:hypothetical protein
VDVTRARLAIPGGVALLAIACAGPRPVPAPPAAPDCAALRSTAVRACVDGFAAEARPPREEDELAVRFALEAACPYAGAIAWSGCGRGAFERFEGRSALGRCGDLADYVESSILLSCMRRQEGLAVDAWNALVKRCFAWAGSGTGAMRALCAVDRAAQEGL